MENIDNRDKLKKERKLRKKLKKSRLKDKKAKEREDTLLLKLRPSDQHISIINRNTVENVNSGQKPCTAKQINLNECMNDFPIINSSKIKNSPRRNYNIQFNHSNVDEPVSNALIKCKKSKSSISVDIAEIISPVKPQKVQISTRVPESNILFGNFLDSDNPKRKRGKKKESTVKCLSALRKQINLERNNSFRPTHEFEIRSYCDNKISVKLNTAVENLLRNVVNFQQRILSQESQKILQKRRFVVGFHETTKLILINKVKVIIIAPNLQDLGSLRDKVEHFKNLAKVHNIYYVFALSRRILGRLVQKQVPVSCVGILNYLGAEELYQQLVQLLLQSKKEYESEFVDSNDQVEKILEIVTEKLNIKEDENCT